MLGKLIPIPNFFPVLVVNSIRTSCHKSSIFPAASSAPRVSMRSFFFMPTRGAVAVAGKVKGGIQISALWLFTWNFFPISSFIFYPSWKRFSLLPEPFCASRDSGVKLGLPLEPSIPYCSDVLEGFSLSLIWATMVPGTNLLISLGFVVECSFPEVKLHSATETTTDRNFPTVLTPNKFPFGVKLVGEMWLQSRF